MLQGLQWQQVATARLATVGNGGTAYRYGGEEFTVVFPGKTADEVTPELERLRGWPIRAAERELRRTHTRREALALVSRYKHRLGLTHGG